MQSSTFGVLLPKKKKLIAEVEPLPAGWKLRNGSIIVPATFFTMREVIEGQAWPEINERPYEVGTYRDIRFIVDPRLTGGQWYFKNGAIPV